jgi:hypothetical protein
MRAWTAATATSGGLLARDTSPAVLTHELP